MDRIDNVKVRGQGIFDNYEYLTSLELIRKILEKINEVVNETNTYTDIVKELRKWFDKLDVQYEVNKKLDEMEADGSLEQIINEEIFGTLNTEIVNIKSILVQNCISVKAFKVGNITDTEALQNAINFAKTSRVKTVLIDIPLKITSVNITDSYMNGITIKGLSATNQDNNCKVTVYGTGSVGFDISGSERMLFKDLCVIGDNAEPPSCLLYASRTKKNGVCSGTVIDNCNFLGDSTKALIYNYSGEAWHIKDTYITVDEVSRAKYGFYGTSINSLGVLSPFSVLNDTLTPLTTTIFEKCRFSCSNGNVAVCFESGDHTQYDDISISALRFENCYSINQQNTSYQLINVAGGVNFIGCVDESGATNATERVQPIIHITGVNLLDGLNLIGCVLYGKINTPFLKVECAMRNYNCMGLKTFNSGTWVFTNTLHHARHGFLPNSQKFIATKVKDIEIMTETDDGGNLTLQNNATYRQLRNKEYVETTVSPDGTISASPNSIVYNTTNKVTYLGIGWTPWSWRIIHREEVTS